MIYIVDDDFSVRRSLNLLLKFEKIACNTFESAQDFLENFQMSDNNLLLLDMQMQGLDGCDLLKRLLNIGIKIPVIIITAFDEPSSRKCAEDYGVLAYLKKPVDSKELLKYINLVNVNY